jgi:hypothetical protein
MIPTANRTAPQFAELLNRALCEPGVVSRAYTAFHGYSIGNQILALVQCAERGIPAGPSRRSWAGRTRADGCARARERSRCACRSRANDTRKTNRRPMQPNPTSWQA